jgi:peptide/nickel transport system permease protein
MLRYALKRLFQMVPLLLLVSLISFGLIKLVPGDPAVVMGGPNATPAQIEAIRQNLGLDRPLHTQLWAFIRASPREISVAHFCSDSPSRRLSSNVHP